MAGWIGVDLDGTLAHFDRWRGPMHIGLPIPAMAKRVHDWHARGVEVRIFTARASRPELIPDVQKWLQRNGFPPLAVTNQKDFGMIELWDDRAIQVLYNTGKAVRPNKLEETDKAELFDPDVVYVDDGEESKEIQPTASEIENFKRNIKSSTDQSLNSLGDLLDALDDGDYDPGEAPEKPDSVSAIRKEIVAPVSAEPNIGPEQSADGLPLDPVGFVSEALDEAAPARPKNSIVEIELDEMDMGPDFDDDIEPEISDDATSEYEYSPEILEVAPPETEATVARDNYLGADSELATVFAEPASKQLDDTLDNQPLSKSKDPALNDEDIDLDLTTAMDDMPEDFSSTTLVAKSDKQLQNTPTLTAFPEDELDDFDDLPTFKVERR